MKFIIFILPLFAVLAQAAPSGPYENDSDPMAAPKGNSKIEPEYIKLMNEGDEIEQMFWEAGMDPYQFYCSEFWNPYVIEQVELTPSLSKKIIHFQKSLEQYSMFPDEVFCDRPL